MASHQFVEPDPGGVGFFFEAAPVHPVLAASVLPKNRSASAGCDGRVGDGALIALHIDGFAPGDEGGTVSLRPGGAPRLDYPISAALQRTFKTSHRKLAELTLAAGADWAMTLHSQLYMLRVQPTSRG